MSISNPLENYCALHDIFNCPFAHGRNPLFVDDGRLYTIALPEGVPLWDMPEGTRVTLIMPTGNQHGYWRDGKVVWDSAALNSIDNSASIPEPPSAEEVMDEMERYWHTQRSTEEFLSEVDEILTDNDQMRATPDMRFDSLGLLEEA